MLSVSPATAIRESGLATSEAAPASSTMYESRVNMDLPVSKFTPVSTSVGRGGAPGVGDRAASGANRTRQPFASTWLPGGAGGHLPGGVGVAAAEGGFTASPGTKYLMHRFSFKDMIQPRLG